MKKTSITVLIIIGIRSVCSISTGKISGKNHLLKRCLW